MLKAKQKQDEEQHQLELNEFEIIQNLFQCLQQLGLYNIVLTLQKMQKLIPVLQFKLKKFKFEAESQPVPDIVQLDVILILSTGVTQVNRI